MQYVKLGSWIVDAEALRLVSSDGEHHPIGGRAMSVLHELISANGAVVEKSQLLERVWDGVAVTENSLNQAVTELRQLLEDDPRTPQHIETVRGKGYRLLQAAEQVTSLPSKTFARRLSRANSHHYIVGLLFALSALIAIFLWAPPQGSTKYASAASPDGQWLAYLATNGELTTLYVIDTKTGRRRPLVDGPTPESYALAWSPDGTRIVYNATESTAPNYAINIVSRINGEIFYIKNAKDPARHETDSVPTPLTTPEAYVTHTEWSNGVTDIHRINLGDDLLVVLYDDGRVTGFNWSEHNPEDA